MKSEFCLQGHVEHEKINSIVRTLKEDQPLRLLLNLLFYHFNRCEPSYKSQRIKPLAVIATCNQLNVNNLNQISMTIFLGGDLTDCIRQLVLFAQRIIATFFLRFFRTRIQCSVCYQLYNSQRLIFSQCTFYSSLKNLEN